VTSSHGTFRPSLKALVQQNSEEFILEVTTAGLADTNIEGGLTTLCKLRGIGPATGSLLLSTSSPDDVPFFSDELFRWVFWEAKPACGWDRKIKYSAKEYRELLAKVAELRERVGKKVSAMDLEKVAYVLGKREVYLSSTNETFASPRAEEKLDSKRSITELSPPTTTRPAASKKRKVLSKPVTSERKSSEPPQRTSTRSTRSTTKTTEK
jgi:hypothetical protein